MVIRAKIGELGDYLAQLQERMAQKGFIEADNLYRAVCYAHMVVKTLNAELEKRCRTKVEVLPVNRFKESKNFSPTEKGK